MVRSDLFLKDIMNSNILDNLKSIHKRIERACHLAGRSPSEVTLLPVTKTKSVDVVKSAISLGMRRFGENKVQEAKEKFEQLNDPSVKWCIIGHLQTNKVRFVAKFANELHSLDSMKLAKELDKRLQAEGRSMDILVQVNSSDEPQKYGLEPDKVLVFANELKTFTSIKVKGLMTLAIFSNDKDKVRHCFKRMSSLREQLRQEGPANMSWDTLSMGMSGDFEIAIEEGATEIRVGQAIFGVRNTPDSHYWPEL